jgi:hypothetical protein
MRIEIVSSDRSFQKWAAPVRVARQLPEEKLRLGESESCLPFAGRSLDASIRNIE